MLSRSDLFINYEYGIQETSQTDWPFENITIIMDISKQNYIYIYIYIYILYNYKYFL